MSAGQRVFEIMDLEPDIQPMEGGEAFTADSVAVELRNVAERMLADTRFHKILTTHFLKYIM